MLQFIILSIVFIPYYMLFIYTIKNSEEMASLRTIWRYKGKVKPSETYIKYIKISAIIGIIVITLILYHILQIAIN